MDGAASIPALDVGKSTTKRRNLAAESLQEQRALIPDPIEFNFRLLGISTGGSGDE